jgi:hypothetical protein
MSNLDFNLDNFDLDTIDLSRPATPSSKPSTPISSLFKKSSGDTKTTTSVSVVKSPENSPISLSPAPTPTSNNNNNFGLDLLVNKSKSKPSSNASSGLGSPITLSTSKPTTPQNNSISLPGSKSNSPITLGGSTNGLNNNIKKSSSLDIDLDAELKDLDIGLGSKPKTMSGPKLPDFTNSLTNSGGTSSLLNNLNKSSTNNNSTNTLGNGGPTLGNFNSNNNTSNTRQEFTPSIGMTYEEIQKAKFDLLCKFNRLKKKGVTLPKTFSMSSDYDEMKREYDRLTYERKLDNTISTYRRGLIFIISMLEMGNQKFDPFGVNLKGWSESINDDIDSFDDIFEELYEKYQGDGPGIAPEWRLMFAVMGSAFMVAYNNNSTKTDNNLNDILRNNPELIKDFDQSDLGGSDGPPLFDAGQRQQSQRNPGATKNNFMQNILGQGLGGIANMMGGF